MRWLALAWLAFGASCRSNTSRPPPARDGSTGADVRDVVDKGAQPLTRFARPMTARRVDGGIDAVARDRATGDLTLVRLDDRSPQAPTVMPLKASLDDPELVVSSLDLGVLGRKVTDGGTGRVLLRVAWDADAGVKRIDLSPVGSAVCATMEGVYSIAREATAWRGTFVALTEAGGEASGPTLVGRSEATVICGQHRAFVVTNTGGELRALAWSPSSHNAQPALLARSPSAAGGETIMSALADNLVIAKLQKSTFSTLVWPGETSGSAWRSDAMAPADGRTLEAMEPWQGQLGLLFVHAIAKVKGCTGGEKTDSVAEVGLADVATGKLARAPEPVETWKCGAEPGPFFTGWANGKFVVAWPRGPDAACAAAGVRRGGIGYAAVDPRTGRARVGRVLRPADAIVDAGCDATQCYAVALTRGPNPCDASDGPESGRLEVISYP